MPKTTKITLALACSSLMMLVLTSCSGSTGALSEPGSGTRVQQEAPPVDTDALMAYVEAERATIPQILAQYPGMYSEVEIEGSIEESDGTGGIPAGTYSVVFYDYTYAAEMDWGPTIDALDAQRETLDSVCASAVFPAMRAAGVTGPVSAVWSYGDGRSEFGDMWSHSCSDD